MKITKLFLRKKLGGFDVYIDNKIAFTLSDEDVIKEKVKVGRVLTELEFAHLKQKAEFFVWYNKLLYFLTFRPRSEFEIKRKLSEISFKAKDFDAGLKKELSEQVLTKLRAKNLIGDLEFAKWFASERIRSRAKSGVNKIRSDLLVKGVPSNIVTQVLLELKSDPSSDTSNLLEQAAKPKLKMYLKEPKQIFRRKLATYLLRRGFEASEVFAFVDTLAKTKYNNSRLDELE